MTEFIRKRTANAKNDILSGITVALALVQGYAMGSWFMNADHQGQSLVANLTFGPIPFEVMTMITLTAGTCFIMWLGEQITEKGIGNGASLIIFAGIVAGLPSGTMSMFSEISNGNMSAVIALAVALFMIACIAGIVFCEVAQRRVPVQYSQKGQGKQAMQQQASHLPLKLNFANVIPPIFASSWKRNVLLPRLPVMFSMPTATA